MFFSQINLSNSCKLIAPYYLKDALHLCKVTAVCVWLRRPFWYRDLKSLSRTAHVHEDCRAKKQGVFYILFIYLQRLVLMFSMKFPSMALLTDTCTKNLAYKPRFQCCGKMLLCIPS